MKNPNSKFPLLTTHYSLLITLILLLLSSCNRTNNPNVGQNLSLSPDSLWTPTGDAKLDSLLQLAATAPQDTNLVKLYDEIGDEYYFYKSDFPKAKEYYLKSKDLTEKINWEKGLFLFASRYTNFLHAEGLVDSAIIINQKLLNLEKEKTDVNEADIAILLVNIGVSYYLKGWYETALEFCLQSLSLFEKIGDEYHFAHVAELIGALYGDLAMYEKQFDYYEKALEILDQYPDTLQRGIVLVNYATGFVFINEFDKAEYYLKEAQRIFVLNNNNYYLMSIYINLSNIELHHYDLNKAEIYNRKIIELNLEFGDIDAYCKTNRLYSYIEMYRGNLNKSKEYIKEALETAIEYEMPREIIDCYNHLSNLAAAQHDFINHRLYARIADSLQNESVSEKTRLYAQELSTKYETEKKELEIERQLSVIEKQNLQQKLLIGGIVLSILGVSATVLIIVLLWILLHLRTRHNRELAEINLTKDKFFNIISHDLKNPAIAQRDTLKLLAKNVRTWDTDKIADYLGEMLKSSESEVGLIFNLLSWAQLQTGRIVCTPETFPLSNFISGFSLIGKMAETKNVTFNIQIPDSEIIVGDKHILTTVIRNLLTNAVKFTDTGGTVTLDIAPAKGEKCFAPTGYIISVSDTGIGMTAEELQNIFRIDSRHTRRGTAGESGTGLGLIVCREMLETHGSKLHVESIEGKGSRFWFEISSE